MAASPIDQSDGVVDIAIKSEGKDITWRGAVRAIHIEQHVNRISRCVILLEDGDMPTNTSPVSDDDEFEPGKAIEVFANYDLDTRYELFKGIVVRHSIRIERMDQLLEVECFDAAIGMTVGRHNVNYTEKKNSDIISDVISRHEGVTNGGVPATTPTYSELVQFNVTDWDFIIMRAEASGLVVKNAQNEITLIDLSKATDPKLTLTFGKDIIEFNASIDARNLYQSVSATGWDPAKQAATVKTVSVGGKATAAMDAVGNLTGSTLSEVVSPKDFRLQSNAAMTDDTLDEWAQAQQVKCALAKTCGTVSYQGCALAGVGDTLEMVGVGSRFNGEFFISGITHEIQRGGWQTTATLGLDPDWFAEKKPVASPSAAGLLPPVDGLMVGKVLKLDGDPNNENRIQVSVPINAAEEEGIWARLIQYYASAGFGSFFIPEVGDEVILGFLNNDPSSPVILGSVYSSKQQPAYSLNDNTDNKIKALVTRSGHKVEFDDEKKIITIITPAGNALVFSDDEKSITLTDMNNNVMKMDESGISLDSPKDISLTATGNVSIKATGKIDMSATQDLSAEGLNVDVKAQVGFKAQGSATAELSASGQTTVKGAMVMIN